MVLKRESKELYKRNFRYEAMWQMYSDFEEVLRNSWRGNEEIHIKLAHLQQELLGWNKEVFGRIEGRKRRLINRLNGIQISASRRTNPFLVQLEKELEEELMHTLRQEEVSWFQKLRGKWLEEGHNNTTYYHTKTLIRRRRNKVKMLKNSEGCGLRRMKKL